jgi:hypothetical protein
MDSDDSENQKPLGLKPKSDKWKSESEKIGTNSKKRPSNDSLSSSATKKPRILGISPEAKVKAQPDVKKETDEYSTDDEEDEVPLAQRMKKKSTLPLPKALVPKAPLAKPALKRVDKEEEK